MIINMQRYTFLHELTSLHITGEGVSKLKQCGLKAQISPSPGQRPG